MRNGLTISTGAHVAVLAIGLFAFNDTRPLETQMQESVMIDLVSLEDVSRARAGQEKAPKTAPPKPMVEKVSEETKSQPDHTAKISEKPEIDTASNAPTPPTPQKREEPTPPTPPTPRKPPEPKRAEPEPKIDEMAKPEPKPEPKPKPKPEPPKVEKPKEEPKKEEAKKPEPPKEAAEKPKQDAPKFDSNKIAALLDKRTPTRQAATGREMNTSPSLGTRTGTNARLSQTEIDALRAQIQRCWNPPVGAENAKDLVVRVRIALSPVGELQGEPILVNRGGSPYFQSAAESAMRAVRRCAPYNLPATKYDAWRDVEITFDPREMFRG